MKTEICRLMLALLISRTFFFPMMANAQTERGQKLWSATFSVDVAHDQTLLALEAVEQDQIHLVGEFLFENNSPTRDEGKTAVIEGRQDKKGRFWPSVELRVGDEMKGKWDLVESSLGAKASSKLTVYSGLSISRLRVQLDALKPFIGKRKFAKIILSTGDEAVFPLDHLSPPSEKETNE
jgi:hypothetical protein